VRSSLYPDIKFELDVRVHEDGVVRVRMDEKEGLRNRYDEAASWALLGEPVLSSSSKWSLGREAKVVYGENGQVEVTVEFEPLVVRMKRNGKDQVVLNGQGLLHMEHSRDKVKGMIGKVEDIFVVKSGVKEDLPLSQRSWFEGDTEDGFWEEMPWTDTKPKGPESHSLDINFPHHGHIYGIPQHAARLDLPATKGEGAVFDHPYRLFNNDVYKYPVSSSALSLHGSIPLLHAHSADSTVAVFVAAASETWIDVARPTHIRVKGNDFSEPFSKLFRKKR